MNPDNNQPFEITGADRAVGLLILIIVAIAIGFAVVKRQELGSIQSTLPLYTQLPRSYGILRGAAVKLSGLPIGQIERITLQPQGGVRIDFEVFDEYTRFVTQGSHLEVDSSIGLTAIIGATGMDLVPPDFPGGPLPRGSFVEAIPPTELSDLINAGDLTAILNNVKALSGNLASFSQTVNDHQQLLVSALGNVATLTASLRDSLAAIPHMTQAVETGFDAWRQAGEGVGRLVEQSSENIRVAASNARDATAQLGDVLSALQQISHRADRLLDEIHQTAGEMPSLLSDSHALIDNANELTEKLNRHWLLGGDRPKQPAPLPSLYPTQP